MGLTVVNVCRALGVELKPETTWSIGAIVRQIYQDRFGHLPPKELRQKTSGTGSHCFAVYPEEMRAEIERVIREHRAEASRQLTFKF